MEVAGSGWWAPGLCKHTCKEVCDVKQGIDPYPLLARSCDRWWPDFVTFAACKRSIFGFKRDKNGVMRFKQVQKFVLAKKIFWDYGLTLIPSSLHLAVSRPLTCYVVQWWQVDKICILYNYKSLLCLTWPLVADEQHTARTVLWDCDWDGSLWTSQPVACWW